MSNRTGNKNPSFFEPTRTERTYKIYTAFDGRVSNDDYDIKSPTGIDKRYQRRIDMWRDHSRQQFSMPGKNLVPVPRILVTGSRDWDDIAIIRNSLLYYSQHLAGMAIHNKKNEGYMSDRVRLFKPILISGNCPSGADLIAETIAEGLDWEVERYPAKWMVDGKKDPNAGFVRNEQMVTEHEPDICLAFQLNKSNGTQDCIGRTFVENIYTIIHSLTDTQKWG